MVKTRDIEVTADWKSVYEVNDRAKLPNWLDSPGIFGSPALRVLCLRLGTGSGCTCLYLQATIPKVNFQEETKTNNALLTLQEERTGSPTGGSVQPKQRAHLLTLMYVF